MLLDLNLVFRSYGRTVVQVVSQNVPKSSLDVSKCRPLMPMSTCDVRGARTSSNSCQAIDVSSPSKSIALFTLRSELTLVRAAPRPAPMDALMLSCEPRSSRALTIADVEVV